MLYIPDLASVLYPSTGIRTYIQEMHYYRNLTLAMLVFINLTVFLGSLLVSITSFKLWRKLLSAVAFLLVISTVELVWHNVVENNLPTFYLSIFNGKIIWNLGFNFLVFSRIFSLPAAELLLVSTILTAIVFFPFFRRNNA